MDVFISQAKTQVDGVSAKVIEEGARVTVMSHLGRPKGEANPKFSLRPVAERLAELLGRSYLVDPQVDVVVEEYNSQWVMVTGEVPLDDALLWWLTYSRANKPPDRQVKLTPGAEGEITWLKSSPYTPEGNPAEIDYIKMLAETAAPESIKVIKAQIYRHLNMNLEDSMNESNQLMADSLKGDDFKEGVTSFVERRPPNFKRVAE